VFGKGEGASADLPLNLIRDDIFPSVCRVEAWSHLNEHKPQTWDVNTTPRTLVFLVTKGARPWSEALEETILRIVEDSGRGACLD
jgi:hypothetical protein